VNFHLQPGEMAFLTGHSGAGKSTLLKLICGIERPSAGKIFFSGHEISRLKSREVPFLRRQIGMIFQDHHLLMDRTVYDNVAIPLIIAGASGDDIRRRVSAALDKVGLLDKAKNFPIQLSGGEQQRVGSPARWSTSLRCCWRMNRPVTSTRRSRRDFTSV
jgi:cell division transport system ATP-binding protein